MKPEAVAETSQKSAARTDVVTEKPKWKSSLSGSIGKVGSWERTPSDAFVEKKKDKATSVTTEKSLVPGILGALVATAIVGFVAVLMQQRPVGPFLIAFPALFALAVLAYVMAKQAVVEKYNLEYALWAVLVGMVICNTIGVPKWLRPAVRGELFIKIGLVLLGAEVLFGKLLALGVPVYWFLGLSRPSYSSEPTSLDSASSKCRASHSIWSSRLT